MIILEILFKKNMALELICSLKRYAQHDKLTDRFESSNHRTSEEMLDWIEHTRTHLSSFMDKEIKELFGTNNIYFATLCLLIMRNNIDGTDKLLNFIDKMDAVTLFETLCEIFELDKNLTQDRLQARLSESFDNDKITIMTELINHNDETLDRIKMLIPKYYKLIFRDIEKSIEEILDLQIPKQERLFSKLGTHYTNTVLGVEKDFLENFNKIIMYISHFHEYLAIIFEREMGNCLPGIIGYQLESKLDKTRISENRKLLFKVLSDEKRVEILQLVSKRSWYGNELAKHLGITTATLSYHVAKLFNLDIITFQEGENKRLYYKLNKERLKELFENSLKDIIE